MGSNVNGQMPTLVTQVSADQDVAWKCEFCDHGISLEAFTSAGANRVARDKMDHKKQRHPRISWNPTSPTEPWPPPKQSRNGRLRSVPVLAGFHTFRWPLRGQTSKGSRVPGSGTVGRAVSVGLPSNGTSLRESTSRNAPAPDAGFLQPFGSVCCRPSIRSTPKRPRVVLEDVQNCSSVRRRRSFSAAANAAKSPGRQAH